MEEKRLTVNAEKTKIMICGTGLDLLQSSAKFPCAVCHTGVGSNIIFYISCKHWVLTAQEMQWAQALDKRTLITGVHRCQENAGPLDDRPQREVQAGGGCFLLLPRRHAISSRWLSAFDSA